MARLPTSLVRLWYRVHVADIVAGAAAPIAAVIVRETSYFSRAELYGILLYSLIATAATVVSVLYFRVGQILALFLSTEDIKQILKASAAATLLTAGVAFSVMRLDMIPRSMPVLHFMLLACMLVGMRWLRSETLRKQDRSMMAMEDGQHTLLVGATRMAWLYLRMPALRQKVIAVLDDDHEYEGRSICGVPVAGRLERAEAILIEYATHGVAIGRVVMTYHDAEAERSLSAICARHGIEFERMLDRFEPPSEDVSAPVDVPEIAPEPSAQFAATPYLRVRRGVEILAAGAAIILLSPIFLLVAVTVLIDVGAPTVFWQQRVGRFGKPMFVHKFRTLRSPIDRAGRLVPEEQRLSKIGAALRTVRLDELPQLLDVLRGQMSLIGPRPLLPIDMPDEASIRLQVPPGVTGWAQVHGGKLIDADEKNALDEWYIANVSFRIDLQILWRTIVMAVRGDRRDEDVVREALQFRARRLLSLRGMPVVTDAVAEPLHELNERAA